MKNTGASFYNNCDQLVDGLYEYIELEMASCQQIFTHYTILII